MFSSLASSASESDDGEPFVFNEPFDSFVLLTSFLSAGNVGIKLDVVRNLRGKTTCCILKKHKSKNCH